MSRHSHWAKIKRGKFAEDAKKGAAFTKLSRMITIAAREKGPDPAMNFKLRLAIDAARAANMPKDTIERAIARATGSAGEGALEEVVYEAIGPGGVAIIIEAVTDNKNRTSGNIKTILSKHGGNFSGPGAVKWQFEQKGIIMISPPRVEGEIKRGWEELTLKLIEAGAEDIKEEDDGLTVITAPEHLQKVIESLASRGLTPEHSGLEWIPKNTVTITDSEMRSQLDALGEALDADDDISDYATNEAH